jgi:hypothetical protein
MPLIMSPAEMLPVGEERFTAVPASGAKQSPAGSQVYNCAVTVMEVSGRFCADIMLKHAATEVMIPPRGRGNASAIGPGRLSVPGERTPSALCPKPTSPRVRGVPDAPVVKMTGVPDENGIMAEEPAGPVGPIGPTGPVAPVGPVGPVGPGSPVKPWNPIGPLSPGGPGGPGGPEGQNRPPSPAKDGPKFPEEFRPPRCGKP